jgi:hypothetical protein
VSLFQFAARIECAALLSLYGSVAAALPGCDQSWCCRDGAVRVVSRVIRPDLSRIPPDRLPAGKYVFENERRWRDFFSRFGVVPPLDINFLKESVAAVILGEQPSSGHAIDLIAVVRPREDKSVRIHVREIVPNPRRGYTAEVTYPTVFVAFAKPEAVPVLFCISQSIDER